MVERYPGDPGAGQYYVGWAAPQSIATGQGWSTTPLSVYHTYSTATDARVDSAKLDTAIAAGMIASQSFKLTTWTPAQISAGSADAAIDASAAICIARDPNPIWLCYYHEPEDNFPSSGNASDYRAAYRYIVQRFRDAGVTNVAWMPIFQAPYTFRTTAMGRPGGGSNRDWRWWHPDWNGGTSGTSADWDSDLMMDILGLDVYDPLPGGTSEQNFTVMLDDTLGQIDDDGYPAHPIVFPEFGMSNVATPTPSWVDWCATARDYALANDINAFVYWNNNNDSPRRYDFTSSSDPTGSKLAGWHVITDGAGATAPAEEAAATITVTPSTIDFGNSFNYIDVPTPMFLQSAERGLYWTPGVINVTLDLATPGATATFRVDGVIGAVSTVGTDGTCGPISLQVGAVSKGVHTVTATVGTKTVPLTFTVFNDPRTPIIPAVPDADPVIVPEAIGTFVQRWVLQDLMPGGLGSWVMPANPRSMTPIPRQSTLDAQHSTSVHSGQFHVTEAEPAPLPWSFQGYSPDQEFYDNLTAYWDLNRRFYLIDHRNRAWTVTFDSVEVVPRKRQKLDNGSYNDWAGDYTVKAIIYGQDPKTPV